MSSKALLTLLPLAVRTLASPTLQSRQTCGHHLLCCGSVQPANVDPTATLLGLLGIAVTPGTTPVGINCTPVSVIGGISWCVSTYVSLP
ncbi:hypothetical protein FA15DRAFT_588626 [Coprinopsis marcescibilis]|uniref:Hydrophobin n=1 Tax=Coprinopsis marcescibilis TaxID=230819 RepID=A0A5C3L264_COPMA|nr:hypothetical protein FA15DRAFT_588626 [Coprinopsis marcescibilis]